MTLAAKYDRMQDALADYAREDRIGADDYCAEGYRLAEEAFGLFDALADIEGRVYEYPDNAQYLVAVSADYRLAELVARDDCYPFVAPAMERAA